MWKTSLTTAHEDCATDSARAASVPCQPARKNATASMTAPGCSKDVRCVAQVSPVLTHGFARRVDSSFVRLRTPKVVEVRGLKRIFK